MLRGPILGEPEVIGGGRPRTAKGSIAVPFSFAANWRSKYAPGVLGSAATATGSLTSAAVKVDSILTGRDDGDAILASKRNDNGYDDSYKLGSE